MTLTGKRLPRINRESASQRGRKRREGNVLEMEGDLDVGENFIEFFISLNLVVYISRGRKIRYNLSRLRRIELESFERNFSVSIEMCIDDV